MQTKNSTVIRPKVQNKIYLINNKIDIDNITGKYIEIIKTILLCEDFEEAE